MGHAAVKNAADPQQVKRAARKQRDDAARLQSALRAVLATADGRVVLWELLSQAGVYRSIWHPGPEIHYFAGRQDFGHELMASLIRTDPAGYVLMETEARARMAQADAEAAAAQTPGAADT